jgi:polyphenol oxidase
MTGPLHPEWLRPEWPAPTNVRAFITTRAGGVSSAPYASLNIGLSTGDDPQAIAQNRARVRAVLPEDPRWLKQVHGARVVDADELTDRPEADASVAQRPGAVCAIQIADCLPVLLTDRAGSVVGAAHAGWRGLAAGVIDNTVTALVARGARRAELLAYLGPAIGPAAFEVGDDVYDVYTRADAATASAFERRANGKWLADLFALARHALARCGVAAIYGGGFCTYSDQARFYSYRRDKVAGRMGAFIWLE